MENKINKKKIVKYAGAGLLATYLFAIGGMHLYDKNVKHENDVQLTYEYNMPNTEKEIDYVVPAGYVIGYNNSEKPLTIEVIGELADPHYIVPNGYIAVKKTNGAIKTIKYSECDINVDGYKIIQVQERLRNKYYAVKTELALDDELNEDKSLSK